MQHLLLHLQKIQHRKHNVRLTKLSSQHPEIVIDDAHSRWPVARAKQVIVVQVVIEHVQIPPLLPSRLFWHHLRRHRHTRNQAYLTWQQHILQENMSDGYLKVGIIERSNETSTPRHPKLRLIVSIYKNTQRQQQQQRLG